VTITTGEATLRLLGRYGVDTVFGIPGVHTLDFCRGLGTGSAIRHVQARNEQGAGLMADGYARSTGRPGVALTISGPGVTNAATALGQAWADSVPLLLMSSDADSRSIGKGWGMLHEVTDLTAVTRPLTAFSARARRPEDVPELLAQAFAVFASARPRPVHIAVPVDVQAELTDGEWRPAALPGRPQPDPRAIDHAARLLGEARRPAMILGGGAAGAGAEAVALAERIGATVVATNAGKGIVPDTHPLSLSGAISRPPVLRLLAEADVVIAAGTELAETDHFVDFRIELPGRLVRVDIDRGKMNDLYPADVPVLSDAAAALGALLDALPEEKARAGAAASAASVRAAVEAGFTPAEARHARFFDALRQAIPADAMVFGDACQPGYSGPFMFRADRPRRWHYAAGYLTLGPSLPGAIGAKLASPETPVAVVIGDGGLMFTAQELLTAAEHRLPLPVIVWENSGYKQIRDGMRNGNIPRVGVDGINPDFPPLADAMRCAFAEPGSRDAFVETVGRALAGDRPTLILVHENADWLD
jgi:5-guanidino-2-oxopentanoate decarboxylase